MKRRNQARTVVFRSEGADTLWATRMHEAGHVVMTRASGGWVTRVTIGDDGTGSTESVFPPWVDLHLYYDLACDYAGAIAEGIDFDHPACASDIAYANRTLRHVPWTARRRIERRSKKTARNFVGPTIFGPRWRVIRTAHTLPNPGTRRFRR
ncbi:hypothetical protein [Pseudonocardia sp. ICBG601]|uniref:hypothetical protein n=1 Tax=Pseudonocardia sp. ICBG601 TaxID=2846759 RepID=UPI001CF65D71|nr:hypothetical protein [Pseudonocardia sp. ICBG601]